MDTQLLKRAGLKVTPHRKAMLEILMDAHKPLTVEEVYQNLFEKKQLCDLSTVYRALNTMAEHQLLQKSVHQDGCVYYQLSFDHHSHFLVCECCHESVPIDLCPLEQLEREIREDTGYEITGHQFEISGLCPKCAQKRGGKK